MGLPCPNLGTGGYAFHGPCEHITVEGMDYCCGESEEYCEAVRLLIRVEKSIGEIYIF